jgi:hypothetical protein
MGETPGLLGRILFEHAGVAELADAAGLGPVGTKVP